MAGLKDKADTGVKTGIIQAKILQQKIFKRQGRFSELVSMKLPEKVQQQTGGVCEPEINTAGADEVTRSRSESRAGEDQQRSGRRNKSATPSLHRQERLDKTAGKHRDIDETSKS